MLASLKTVLRRVLFLLAIYSGIRLLFFIHHHSQLASENVTTIAWAFLQGVRFDLSILLTINLPFILIWAWPWRWQLRRRPQLTLHALFVAVNAFFVIVNVSDIELINFNARRMTYAFFMLRQDMGHQLPQLIAYYWMWTLVDLFCVGALIFLTPRYEAAGVKKLSPAQKGSLAFTYLVFIFALLVGIRGGLQNKPVREAHAFQHSAMIGHLALNTPFTLIHSRKKGHEKELKFMADEDAKKILLQGLRSASPLTHATVAAPPNVVVIILESFSREYMGKINGRQGYTPFLDELADKSLFFTNHFANARRSIEAIPAILTSMPSLLREPFLLSSYQAVQLRGLPQVLATHGYQTAFFHGAENGSMFFDSFASRIGYEKYYGMSEYPESDRDWDGFWGILDEPFFQYFSHQISSMRQPFFATIFSLSSHQPYPIPPQLKGKFPKGTLEIHESIGYADYALRQFFQEAEKQPWFNNTLFVITADHTQKSDDPNYANTLGPYRSPLLFYKPGEKWAGKRADRVTQHADIPASILDYLGFQNENIIPLGQSVFNGKEGFFVARQSDFFIFHDKGCTAKMTLEGEWTTEEGQCDETTQKFFKAYVQYFTNGVIRNALF